MRQAASAAVLLEETSCRQATSGLGDLGIIERLRAGDREAFTQLYEQHLEFVMQMLTHGFTVRDAAGGRSRVFVSNACDIEDLCQEAFAVFFRQCTNGNFDASREVRPYLRSIVAHLAIRGVGRGAREELWDEPPELQIEPERRLEDEECARLVSAFRETLNPTDEAIVDGCFGESRSQMQVGDALGLSRDQVYRSIVKIRRRARAFFRAKGWFDEP